MCGLRPRDPALGPRRDFRSAKPREGYCGPRTPARLLGAPTLLYFSTVLGPRPQPKVKEPPSHSSPPSLLGSGGAASRSSPCPPPPPVFEDLPRRAQNEGPPPNGLCLQPADSARFLATARRRFAADTSATHQSLTSSVAASASD